MRIERASADQCIEALKSAIASEVNTLTDAIILDGTTPFTISELVPSLRVRLTSKSEVSMKPHKCITGTVEFLLCMAIIFSLVSAGVWMIDGLGMITGAFIVSGLAAAYFMDTSSNLMSKPIGKRLLDEKASLLSLAVLLECGDERVPLRTLRNAKQTAVDLKKGRDVDYRQLVKLSSVLIGIYEQLVGHPVDDEFQQTFFSNRANQ